MHTNNIMTKKIIVMYNAIVKNKQMNSYSFIIILFLLFT